MAVLLEGKVGPLSIRLEDGRRVEVTGPEPARKSLASLLTSGAASSYNPARGGAYMGFDPASALEVVDGVRLWAWRNGKLPVRWSTMNVSGESAEHIPEDVEALRTAPKPTPPPYRPSTPEELARLTPEELAEFGDGNPVPGVEPKQPSRAKRAARAARRATKR